MRHLLVLTSIVALAACKKANEAKPEPKVVEPAPAVAPAAEPAQPAPTPTPTNAPAATDDVDGDGAAANAVPEDGDEADKGCKEGSVICSDKPPEIDAPGYKPVGAKLMVCKGGTWTLKEDCTTGNKVGCYQRDNTAYCGTIGD